MILAGTCLAPNPRLRLWNVLTGEEQPPRLGHTNHIAGLSLNPNGEIAATASWDGTVRLWDTRPGHAEERTIDFTPFGAQVNGIAFSPEGRYLAVAAQNGQVAILRALTSQGAHRPRLERGRRRSASLRFFSRP